MDEREGLIRSLIRDVPDFPKKGILFKDITTLVGSHAGLQAAVDLMAERWQGRGITKVASLESRGFIFGSALALRLGAGFLPLRKPGKLPWKTRRVEYSLEYGTDAIEVHVDGAGPGDVVLVVDDLLATGGSARAAAKLVGELGAKVAGAAFVVELAFLDGRAQLGGIPEIQSIVVFD